MADQLWIVVWYSVIIGISPSDCSIHIEVNPSNFKEGLTMTMEVNCTFDSSGPSNVSNLISLAISKSGSLNDGGSIFRELVSVNTFDPNTITVSSYVNATAASHIDNNGLSFLTLSWSYPIFSDSGFYRCDVRGLDTNGQPALDMSSSILITAEAPDIDLLIETVRYQQMAIQDLQSTLTQVTTFFDTLVKKQSSQDDLIGNLTDTVNTALSNLTDRIIVLENYKESILNFLFMNSAEYSGKMYLLSKNPNVFVDISQVICGLVGGYLAEINDSGENEFIKEYINTTLDSEYMSVLLGGTDAEEESYFGWRYSQTSMNYSDWESGEPDCGTGCNCLFLYRGYSWRWDDDPCTRNYPFLCEVSKRP